MATRDFIRPRDINAFTAAAKVYKVYILVRRTNPASLKYIGMPGFAPKPLDCKPKTADVDIVVDGRKREIAGLVVDPTLVGAGAFKAGKHAKAMTAWSKFRALQPPTPKGHRRPYLLAHGKTYMVQDDPGHKHYGCLMWLPNGTTAIAGKYIHGDYDLYAVVPAANVADTVFVKEERMGQHHARGKELLDVQVYVNSQIGAPMVRHGDQEKYGDHSDEDVDVFFPDGRVQELRGLAAIETFYRTEFKGRRPAGQGRATVPTGGGAWVRIA
jgi:hypothetical protein